MGSVVFVPPGFADPGAAKIVSYNNGNWAHATLTPDGSGTYDVATNVVTTLSGGPEGEVYVSDANPGFAADSILVSAFDANEVDAYEIDANGDPLAGTKSLFLNGLTGAEAAVIDPVTGDFLFSTFGGDNQLVVVSGFVPPPPVPEPSALALFGTALAAWFGVAQRRKPG